MKSFLLFLLAHLLYLWCPAQSGQVNTLPLGKYETILKAQPVKWERGDIILLDEEHYRLSTSQETGEYKFSISAQRIFFTSGPLKSLYARTTGSNTGPAIIFPVAENVQQGHKIHSEVWGIYKQ